ncbi:acyl-CoA dehydrogenase family protein [Colwellia sp. 12G3]
MPEVLNTLPWPLVKQMGEAGLFAIPFEKKYGGAGL